MLPFILIIASCAPMLATSCAPILVAVPDETRPYQATVGGVRLAAVADAFPGSIQHDLQTHVLPVAVELRNEGAVLADISLGDFVLVNERGAEVHACLLDQVLRQEPEGAPPPRGPLLATVAPPASAAPDTELQLRGPTAPKPVPESEALGLPQGALRPGQVVRGFLYFKIADVDHPQPLRLRWQAHAVGTEAYLGEVEVHIRLVRAR